MKKFLLVMVALIVVCGAVYFSEVSNRVAIPNGALVTNVDGEPSLGTNYTKNEDYDYVVDKVVVRKGLVLENGKSVFVPSNINKSLLIRFLDNETLEIYFK